MGGSGRKTNNQLFHPFQVKPQNVTTFHCIDIFTLIAKGMDSSVHHLMHLKDNEMPKQSTEVSEFCTLRWVEV